MEKSYAEYQDEIRKALRAMQSRSLKAHLRLLALVLLVAALCLLIRAFAPLVGTVIGAILALGLLGLTAYTLGVARGAICPLCHKPFYVRRYESGFRYYNDFTGHCLNCGVNLDGSNAMAILQAQAKTE